MNTEDRPSVADSSRDSELSQIRESLRGLRFGSVHIIVQDGVVIQIERTEKCRLRRTSTVESGSYR